MALTAKRALRLLNHMTREGTGEPFITEKELNHAVASSQRKIFCSLLKSEFHIGQLSSAEGEIRHYYDIPALLKIAGMSKDAVENIIERNARARQLSRRHLHHHRANGWTQNGNNETNGHSPLSHDAPEDDPAARLQAQLQKEMAEEFKANAINARAIHRQIARKDHTTIKRILQIGKEGIADLEDYFRSPVNGEITEEIHRIIGDIEIAFRKRPDEGEVEKALSAIDRLRTVDIPSDHADPHKPLPDVLESLRKVLLKAQKISLENSGYHR